MKLKENILYHMHHVKLILLVWLLAWWDGCVDAEKHTCTLIYLTIYLMYYYLQHSLLGFY